MRPPRRVPWASKAELAELYDMIFAPGANEGSRAAAISRMSVYISSPFCPAFMHLLHSLVGALQLPYPPRDATEASAARMVYAMALVRFVNGMVDPLQTGPYARPISHLAATLNLPPGVVALRHRATHEDLPPLPLLRRSLEQSMHYLHEHSFLPLLALGEGQATQPRAYALVERWKKVQKARVRSRDVSAESDSGVAVKGLRREFEGEDVGEVLEAIVRVGFVPVARKKRPSRKASQPSTESQRIWIPLLEHLSPLHPNLGSDLAETLVSVILDSAPRHAHRSADEAKDLASYRWTLGLWLRLLWGGDGELSLPDDGRAGVLRQLARELIHGDDVVRRVLGLLDDATELATFFPPQAEEDELEGLEVDGEPEAVDVDGILAGMQANLAALQEQVQSEKSRDEQTPAVDGDEVSGWRWADQWRSCPIGIWA